MSHLPHSQTAFSPQEFTARRQRMLEAIGPPAVAVLQGAPATGAFDHFRQTNDFFYLCGVEVPHAYLLLDGRSGETTLYLPHHDAKHARSEGEQLHCDAPEVACKLTGVQRVSPLAALADHVAGAKEIFVPHEPAEGRQACRDTLRHAQKASQADPWERHESREEHFQRVLAGLASSAAFSDLSPVLDALRLVKSAAELSVMRRAGMLTAQAIEKAMQATRPGMWEYELAAIADYHFLAAGAVGPGYRAIVAGGANIWNAHYFRNDCRLQSGDLVLMDYAPDVANYTSDIGRMWPVDRHYSPLQRELYGFVVEYHKALLAVLRPHARVAELVREAAERVEDEWSTWPFSKESYRAAARKMIDSQVAFTHPVGMAVHDVGEYRSEPLRPGLVFALDPQLWVPEEQLYFRVEDTVAITDDGVDVLTSEAALELDEVEDTMRR